MAGEAQSDPAGVTVARVAALHRFPVKSMAGEALEEAELLWTGVAGDRRHAFVRGDVRSDFPWLTIRQVPGMLRYRAAAGGRVRTPDGRDLAVEDPALADELAAAYGGPVRLLHSKRGVPDSMPVSLLSLQAVAAVGDLAGRALEPVRFRANVVVDAGPDGGRFPEERWIGRTLGVGEAEIRLDLRDERCAVVNFEPGTAARQPEVLRAVAQERASCLGVYGSTVRPGRIRVGDPVRLL